MMIYKINEYLDSNNRVLAIIEQDDVNSNGYEWVLKNKALVMDKLINSGGVLLRGFKVNTISEFYRIVKVLIGNLDKYMFRSTPREELGKSIYTATSYPSDRHIPLHNEFSYYHKWPSKIAFYCCIPPELGGETPIANSARVYSRIPKEIRDEFNAKGVRYVRNYHEGLDLPWQEVFQTNDKSEVIKYCEQNEIEFSWLDGSRILRTSHTAQAITMHPKLKVPVWFNQAHLFHPHGLGENIKDLLLTQFDDEFLPRNAFYADGSSIDINYLDEIQSAYDAEVLSFQWQKGDIMLLDNVLIAHGRKPYSGNRKIAVAMG